MYQVLFRIPLYLPRLQLTKPIILIGILVCLAFILCTKLRAQRTRLALVLLTAAAIVFWMVVTPWFEISVPIFGFGVMLCLAFLLCTWMAARRARRAGIPPETMQDLAIWLFVCGLLGARLTFLLQEKPGIGLVALLTELPQIWTGGIILYGSAIGAFVGYLGAWYFIFRPRRIGTLALADVAAPAIALGLALGRIGCFLNGCCYGAVACPDCPVWPVVHFPMSAPPREDLVKNGIQTAAGFTYAEEQPDSGVRVGAVALDSPAWQSGLRPGDIIVQINGRAVHELPNDFEERGDAGKLSRYMRDFGNWQGKQEVALTVERKGGEALMQFDPVTVGLYPAQLYETVSMILLMLVLLAYEPFRRREGQVMALLLLGYGVHRYLNEMLRSDPRPIDFERYTSLFVAGTGLAMWLILQSLSPRAQPAPQVPVAAGAGA
jgi:phosphatidylglycerol:prolipoprotein diacylglycerol transferase